MPFMGRSKGTGSVFYRKDRETWAYRYWVTMIDGRRKPILKHAPNKRAAEQRLKAAVIATKDIPQTPDMTLADFAPTFLASIKIKEGKSKGVSKRTKDDYARYLATITLHFGNALLKNIKTYQIDDYLEEMGETRTAQMHRLLFGMIYKEAIRKEIVTHNPVTLTRPINYSRAHEPVVFTAQTMQEIINAEPNPVYATFYAFLWATGARPWSEVAPLTWEALIEVNGEYYFRGAKTEAGSKPRAIPNWLIPELRKLSTTGRLFPANMDSSRVRESWAEALKKLDIPHTRIYDIRHTYATVSDKKAARLKKSDKVVSAQMGHSGTAITRKVYIHTGLEELREFAEE